MSWEVGPELSLAQLLATIARADQGSGFARVRVYTSDRPASISAHSEIPQVEIVLAKPCASVVGGVLVMHPAEDASMVMQTGIPRWGDLVAASGAILARADVTDTEHDGGWRLVAGETPAGETSPLLRAGGLVQLGATALS
ncbi:hypothetical protein [Paracidovorax cattleyae]|uniref:Uncharacterized protein n=1 Tax=Paracidovorax cattleyae TaxID=80868 RepID=A0A1H0N1Q4_9BURK|nr:hypothetical protein [Paracidovorax cattleyae]AVS75636.1 hypothetical protein C8240_18055 [Paracidovorax cattleyae]SDO86634.1 hypothetical protein SAMN04489708_104163 [Paracidovorax cattleyae]